MATRKLSLPRAAVLVAVLTPSLAACEQRYVVCTCLPPPTPREELEGTFLHEVESIEVRDGDYTPPPLPLPMVARAMAGENFFLFTLDDSEASIVFRVDAWVDVQRVPGSSGGCCGPAWDGLALTDPQPPWSERNRMRIDTTRDIGTFLTVLDPTLVSAEPAFPEQYDGDLGIVGDADGGGGFVLRADHLIHPEGCDDLSCTATVRISHHFRRVD